MRSRKIDLVCVIAAAVLCCGGMTLVDGVWQPGYALKSAVKIALFGLLPLLLSRFRRDFAFGELLRFQKKGFAKALALGVGLYALILAGFFLFSQFIDFSPIAGKLTENAGVSRRNFLWVSLYISFVNSLLEELFFRGFLFANLKKLSGRGFAYGFSALAFSLYHTAMMLGWFSPWLFLLVLAGLGAGGMIFNRLNEKSGTVYASWLVHMFANFAINTIGFILFAG